MHPRPAIPLLLQAKTPLPLSSLLPTLSKDLRSAGVWLVESRPTACGGADLHLELHRHAAPLFYTALVRRGLQLNRSTHVALASLCSYDHSFTGTTTDLKLEIRSTGLAHPMLNQISVISA